ncbi:MAG: hypothetical protein R3B70_22950 [Polyangiaceae bacterium]
MSAARRPFLLSALGAGLGLAGSALLATGACVPPELISEVGATSTEGGTAGSTSAGGAGSGGSGAGSTTGGAGSGGATSTTGTTGTGAAGSGGGTTTTSTTTTSTGDPLLACLAACPMNVGMCNAAGVCVITCNGSLACPTTVTCPAGIPCEVQCGGMQSCAAGVACGAASACTVACTGDHACTGTVQKPTAVSCPGGGCDVLCTGKDSCPELALDCNAGPCSLECAMGLRACETVNCDGDCTIACSAQESCHYLNCTGGPCNVECSGTQSCDQLNCAAACACDVKCVDPGKSCYFDPVCPKDTAVPGPCNLKPGCTSAVAGCDACSP